MLVSQAEGTLLAAAWLWDMFLSAYLQRLYLVLLHMNPWLSPSAAAFSLLAGECIYWLLDKVMHALQEYNCEIGACLLHLKAGPDPAVEARMQTLTLEALTLTGRVMLNPANHKAIVNGRLDEARPVAQRPGRPFYESILVS